MQIPIWAATKLTLLCLLGVNFLAHGEDLPASPILPTPHAREVVATMRLPGTPHLVSAAADGLVKVWETGTGLLISEYATTDAWTIVGLAAHPQRTGEVAIAVREHMKFPPLLGNSGVEVRIVDLMNHTVLRTFSADVKRLNFSPSGRWLVSSNHTSISIFDADTGKLQVKVLGSEDSETTTFLNDDTLVYQADGKIVFLDITSGQHRTLQTGRSKGLAVSRDNNLLAETVEKELRIWNIRDGVQLASRPLMITPQFVFFAEDGSVVAGDHHSSMFSGSAMNLIYRIIPGDWKLESYSVGKSPITALGDGGDSVLLGQHNGEIQRLDIKGQVLRTALGVESDTVTALDFSPDGRYLAAGFMGGAAVVWEPTSNWYRVLDPHHILNTLLDPEFSDTDADSHVVARYNMGAGVTNAGDSGKEELKGLSFVSNEVLILVHSSGKADLINVASGKVLASLLVAERARTVVAHPGVVAAVLGGDELSLIDAQSYSVRRIDLGRFGGESLALSAGGDRILIRGIDGTAEYDVATGALIGRSSDKVGGAAYDEDGRPLALTWHTAPDAAHEMQAVTSPQPSVWRSEPVSVWRSDIATGVLVADTGIGRIWSRKGGSFLPIDFHAGGAAFSIALAPDGRTIVVGTSHGRISFHSVETGAALAELATYGRRGWLARALDGHFDGTYAAWASLRGTRSGERLTPVEPYAMFDAWYRPQLLAAVTSNQVVELAPKIATPIGRPPLVRITSPQANYVRESAPPIVTTIRGASESRRDEKGEIISWPVMGVSQENSQVVAGTIAQSPFIRLELEVRGLSDGVGECRIFRNRRLIQSVTPALEAENWTKVVAEVPIRDGNNALSAYCFSSSGLRSKEVEIHIVGADILRRARTAYILTIGINDYIGGFRLDFARADAELARNRLSATLESTGIYDSVVPAVLADGQATATEILRALRILSGTESPPSNGPLSGLRASMPGDAVFIYFAGHGGGYAGDYRLVAADGDPGRGVADGTVSATELREALTPLQADRAVLIIDACESGQALDQVDARAGPLAGRSLAQLAYDKGMFVISAAQSRESARELERLGHGLFSYVLLERGLQAEADENRDGLVSIREWLSFAQTETPKEQEAGRARSKGPRKLLVRRMGGLRSTYADESLNRAQTPRVFIPDPELAREFVITKLGVDAL